MRYLIILILLYIISFDGRAQGRPFISIAGTSHQSYDQELLKIIQREVIKFNQFEVLVTNEVEIKNKEISIYKLSYTVETINKVNKLLFELHDFNSQKLIAAVSKANVHDHQLLYHARKLVYQLLTADETATELKKKSNKKRNAVATSSGIRNNVENTSFGTINNSDDGINQVNTKDQELKIASQGAKRRENKRSISPNQYVQEDVNLDKNSDFSSSDDKRGFTWAKRYKIAGGMLHESIRSDGLVSTRNNLSWMKISGHADFRASNWKTSYLINDFELKKIVNGSEYEFPIAYTLGFGAGFLIGSVEAIGIFRYEKSDFVNLYEIGEGLTMFTSQILWAEVGVRFTIVSKNREYRIESKYGHALAGSISPAWASNISANSFALNISTKIYGNLASAIGANYKQFNCANQTALANTSYGAYVGVIWDGLNG